MSDAPYQADPSLTGKLRRKLLRLAHRRAATGPARPMVSFSFDDAPGTAFSVGADILERRGVRGTYFVCAGTAGQTHAVGRLGGREEIQRAAAAGHEIACHTYVHRDCARLDAPALTAELDRNAEAFQAWGLPRPETFAYPYGEVGASAKRLLGRRFGLARGVHGGLIGRGGDLAQAPAVGIEGEEGEGRALHWIEAAARKQAWLILFTHGVEAGVTPYGCTHRTLERVVDRALACGLEPVTVAEGARRMGAAA